MSGLVKPQVVLFQPKTSTADFIHLDWGRVPYGLVSIATPLRAKGYEIVLIDQRVDQNWENKLLDAIKSKSTICFGTTAITGPNITHALEASRLVKKYRADIPVVWGGVHATLSPEQTLESEYVDIVVMGEGEYIFEELVETISAHASLANIKGIYYKDNGQILHTHERPFERELDKIHEPDFEIVKDYIEQYINCESGRGLDVCSSRGCPFKCTFCSNSKFNRSLWRANSAEEVVRRITKMVYDYRLDFVCFVDDNFFTHLGRVEKICDGFIRENLNFSWRAFGLRIDTANKMSDEMWEKLWEAGCRDLYIGAETGDPDMMLRIDKHITVEAMLEVNRKLSSRPFFVKYNFIIGYPGESEQQLQNTVNVARQLCHENTNASVALNLLAPFPGTGMFDDAVKFGFQPPRKLEDWGAFDSDNWINQYPSWHTKKEHDRLNSIAFSAFFMNPKLVKRIDRRFLRLMFRLYGPIARLRFRHNWHRFPVESTVARSIMRHM